MSRRTVPSILFFVCQLCNYHSRSRMSRYTGTIVYRSLTLLLVIAHIAHFCVHCSPPPQPPLLLRQVRMDSSNTTVLPNRVQLQGQAEQNQWVYYQFTMPRAYEFSVTVVLNDLSMEADLYLLKYNFPHLNAYDVKGTAIFDKRIIMLNQNTVPPIDVAQYFVGVYCLLGTPCAFGITLQQYTCPNDCSNRGQCDNALLQCTCNTGYVKPDCSGSFLQLVEGQPVAFTLDVDYYFALTISQVLFTQYDKLRIILSVSPTISPYYLIFLKHGGLPTRTDYDLKRVNELHLNYTFEISNLELKVNSTLYGWIVNGGINTLSFTSIAKFITNCHGSPMCSGNGVCDTINGKCTCNSGFVGDDCSVPLTGYWWQQVGIFIGGLFLGFLVTTVISVVIIFFVVRRFVVQAKREEQMLGEYIQQI